MAEAAINLEERRSAAQDRLARANADVGKALLDGRRYDWKAREEAQAELDALNAADGERVRREREAAGQEWQATVTKTCARMIERYAERDAKVARANALARELAAELTGIHSLDDEQIADYRRLERHPPGGLGRSTTELRLSDYLSGALAGVGQNNRSRYGAIVMHWTGAYSPETNWQEAERRHLATAIEQLQKGS